jgi:lactoylglutathione lyase
MASSRNFGHLAFAVDDIYQTCADFEALGVAILRPPRDGTAPPASGARPAAHQTAYQAAPAPHPHPPRTTHESPRPGARAQARWPLS